MRADLAGWAVAAGVALVMGGALVATNVRVSKLEAELRKVDDNFVQLSVPLEETVRDISAIYGELDALSEDARAENAPPAPRPERRTAPQRPRRIQPRHVVSPAYADYDQQDFDQFGIARAPVDQEARRRNGTFNDVGSEEDD